MTFFSTYYFNSRYCQRNKKSMITSVISLFFLLMAISGITQPMLIENKMQGNFNGQFNPENEPEITEYDEILITLYVPRIGSIELPALIHNETAYLPVKELFDFLKIKNIVLSDFRIIEGFFIDVKAEYSINKIKNQIVFNGREYQLKPSDIILNSTGLYIRSGIYGQIFGLDCQFNFRNLSVKLLTNIELPAIREMKIEAMHRNLSHLKGEKKVDSIIKRSFSLLRLGMLDWSVISNSETNRPVNSRITLGVGAILMGGETNLLLNLDKNLPFNSRDQFYTWRYVNNDLKVLKQVIAGKILPNPSSTIINAINGIQLKNTPTTFRRSFGTYTLSNKTEPGWMVELYVNNVLIDYTKADASGFFTFEVPMVYGNSVVRLRYYGPFGEEQIKEQNLSIPFNFLPERQFEYDISAGILEDGQRSLFSRSQFSYGVSKKITIGGGMEYLSSVSKKTMPFLTASMRLGSNLFINSEHIQGVRSTGLISYRLPSNVRLEFNYLRYNREQKAINNNFLEEKKLVISKPFRGTKYSVFSRLTINQFTNGINPKNSNQTSTELLLSAVAFGISTNLTNYAIITENGVPLAFSNLSMTFRLPKRINFMPQIQYEYSLSKFSLLRMEVEKPVLNRGSINMSYEWDLKNKNYFIGLGMRINLSFVQSSFMVRQNKQSTFTAQMTRGSILFNGRTNYVGLSNQNNMGRGGLIIRPFLDLNNNGKKDKNEPAAEGLKVKMNGGRIQRNDRDTTIRVTGLEPYTNYYLDLDKSSFENISWQIQKTTLQINVNPNHFTILEIPVQVVGEVSGTVLIDTENGKKGLGRILVNIYNIDSVLVTKTMTESDGYFHYLGLLPGDYYIMVDPDQLKNLNMQCITNVLKATVYKSRQGEFLSGFVFTVRQLPENKKD